jgi:thiol-disulfide isomerase/thioredoxin
MKILFGLLMLAISPLSASAVSVGDSHEQVIEEMGAPATKMEMGDVLVLNYPGQRIKLKGGKVTEVKSIAPEATPTPAPSRPVAKAPAPSPAAPAPASDSAQWMTDYPAALALAREKNRNVFLFFTGSDWCGWCKRLDAEILSKDEFKVYALQNLVLVKLDFPRQVPQPDALKAQNNQLARRYKIGGYPTVIVIEPNGRKVGELHYQKGGPGPFVDALKRF